MDTTSKSSKMWLEFDFPTGCQVGEWGKGFLKRLAAKVSGGACCPFGFCASAKAGAPCGSETAKECARLCDEFYKKYIKEEEK